MYLGLDLGTSGLKAVLIDEDGLVLGTAVASYSVSNPKVLWSEQDPEDWWRACISVTAELKNSGHDLSQVKCLGVAGQMHGATLLDKEGNVLRPCILWNDGRSYKECEQLENSSASFRQLSGNLAMPGFTAPKVMWVANNEPEIFEKTTKILLPKDYLNYRLTNKYCSEMSDAAGTLWLNPQTRDWDAELLQISGVSKDQMPNLFEGHQTIGLLTESVAQELGLPEIPIVAGAGDNAAGAIGVGVTEPGKAFLSLGTSGVIFVVSEKHCASPEHTVHAFCHALPKRWHQMTVALSAANSLSWLANLVQASVSDLLGELESSGIQDTAVMFLPYLSGERTPHNDPMATASFLCLTNGTSRAELTLAVLEGVACSFADGQAALLSAKTKISDITLIGGGAQSARWRQILADVLDTKLTFRNGGEVGPGLGAARLAKIGYLQEKNHISETAFTDLVTQTCPAPEILATHLPDSSKRPYYSKKYKNYQAIYQQTKFLNTGE